ncbi:D-alanyl-D-alanine carboxypeptidase [Herbihabitans rhizosphaerae]|uniref:D-alanyl-D-alanine carboxypeptidase n=1 Tax=Herbihabitans rhizosphaerae TaxID=1872711 RepID=A0A4Q7KCE3_9PSEU|nr:serine hydrolase domain-containing protein [Herbihabitans rhizosphaerae]RZS31129.1 D-alanyl-D-alanine carboxypeptidase [Herbihabitans rhizosphaerae]
MAKKTKWIVGATLATALVAAALVAPSALAKGAGTVEDHARTTQALERLTGEQGLLGAAVVAGDKDSAWNLSRGTGRLGVNQPIQPTDRVRIASNTKTFVAAVVLQLVSERTVELDAPIERYLPGRVQGNGYDGNRISVRQLLQHTSGIADFFGNYQGGPLNPLNMLRQHKQEDLVRAALRTKPRFEPGTSFEYVNTNYVLAGLLIEKVTGRDVGDEIDARIVRPLGLDETTLPKPGDREIAGAHARGYLGGPLGPVAGYIDVTPFEPSYGRAAGAMVSSLDDMATFAQALADGKVIGKAELAEMRKPAPKDTPYGLGLYGMNLSCGGQAFGHNGLIPGYHTLMMATDDGRHASVVINGGFPQNDAIIKTASEAVDAALCETR